MGFRVQGLGRSILDAGMERRSERPCFFTCSFSFSSLRLLPLHDAGDLLLTSVKPTNEPRRGGQCSIMHNYTHYIMLCAIRTQNLLVADPYFTFSVLYQYITEGLGFRVQGSSFFLKFINYLNCLLKKTLILIQIYHLFEFDQFLFPQCCLSNFQSCHSLTILFA